jgi:hypothetical protein
LAGQAKRAGATALLAALAAALPAAFAACGSASGATTAETATTYTTGASQAYSGAGGFGAGGAAGGVADGGYAAGDAYVADEAEYAAYSATGYEAPAAAADSKLAAQAAAGAAAEDAGRKEIKTGEIMLSVKDPQAAHDSVLAIAKGLGGYEFSKTKNTYQGAVSISTTLKLPPEALDAFEARLRETVGEGAITGYSISSDDVTAAYYDTSSRLASYKMSLERYFELLGRADTMEEIIAVQQQITQMQAEIDSMQGQVNMWDRLVAYATISLYITQSANPLEQARDEEWSLDSPGDVARAMQNGFVKTGNAVYKGLVYVAIFVVGALPVLAVIAVLLAVFLAARHIARRRRQRREARAGTGAGKGTGAGAVAATGAEPGGSAKGDGAAAGAEPGAAAGADQDADGTVNGGAAGGGDGRP